MWEKLFGKPSKPAAEQPPAEPVPPPPAAEEHPAERAMRDAIAAKRHEDPLVGAKVASNILFQGLMGTLKQEGRGVHMETALVVVGSLAGYACQAGVLRERRAADPAAMPFHVATTKDGHILYYGDELNAPLAETQYSVWSLCAGTAQQLGAQIPNVSEIFTHVSTVAGTPAFGVPRYPGEGRAGDLPVNYLRVFWPKVFPALEKYCDKPTHWPVALGLVAQQLIEAGREVVDPTSAVRIIMECAIPMSKLDSRHVFAEPPQP